MTPIQEILLKHQDSKYADFSAKLIPSVPREYFIGVRSPEFKKILQEIKELPESALADFLSSLPHQFHEENVLQVCLINQEKDFNLCIEKLEAFLPYINNWAVSDGLRPKVFSKNLDKLAPYISKWIASEKPYTKRVGMLLAMKFYLGDDFKPEFLEQASQIRSEEYYVNMMTAWYFAEALVKQWDSAVEFIKQNRLDKWTHNKAIQKARESFRITPEQKQYLKSLKVS